jgi:transcriptional regulator GlxA family with amidase domain
MIATLESGHPLADIHAMHQLLDLLLDVQKNLPETQGTSRDPRIEACLTLMAQKIDQPLTLRDLAASAGLSPTRFNAVFKSATGISPKQYLANYRMRRACTLLLATDRLIKQIAADVGYPDITQFSARFRKRIGVSPQSYRRNTGDISKTSQRDGLKE